MEKLANKLSNINKSVQTGSQVKSNWALPTNQYVQMAYNDPKFALGNLIGTYLLNRYVGNVDNGEANDMQPKLTTDSGVLPDYQSTLNTDARHRFQVDENGNAAYHAPTLAPAITVDNPIQANQDFKDYYNSYNNKNVDGSGLLDMTQLAQLAGVAPATPTPTDATVVPQAGAVNPNPLNGGNFAIDGDLGKYATTNPQSLTGGTWSYRGKFSPKNYGDIAAVVSPITDNTAMTDTTNNLFVPPKVVEIDKKQVLLPMVSKDGKLWSDQEAFDHYAETGENFGTFDTKEEAEKAAQGIKNGGTLSTATTTTNTPMYTLNGNFPGMIKAGNIDIANRPTVKLPDGRTATVFSKSFNLDGKEVLLPTVSKDGKLWTDQEAVDNYRKTGENLGVFNSPEAADRYAQALHEQQDEMYVRPNEPPIKDETPIKDEGQPIKEEPQPITANTAPITEDKKEQLNGNTLRIQSANDGNMYDFTISSDGKWIQFPNGGKMPVTQKDALITAMHNPKQSYYDIETLATPLHNLPQDVKDAIKNDPTKAPMARMIANNIDSRDMTDSTNPGVFTDNLHIGIPNTTQTPTNPNEVQPFNAEQWKRDFIIRQRKKGFSGDVINDMLGDLMPQAQAQEDKYNRYQAGILMPLYQAAVTKGDYSTAAQLAQGMMQYNQEVGNYMLSSLPTAQNFYATDVAKDRAKTAQDYKITNMGITQKYKEQNDRTAFENNKALKDLTYQQQVELKKLDEALREQGMVFDTQQKIALLKATPEIRYNFFKSHGATDEQALGLADGKGTSSRGSSGVSKSEEKVANNIEFMWKKATQTGDDGKLDHDAVNDLLEYAEKHAGDFDDDDGTYMLSKAYAAQFLMHKAEGNENMAAEALSYIPEYYRHELLPSYF